MSRREAEAPLTGAAKALLERRALSLAAPFTEEEGGDARWVGEFRVANERYALPLASILAAVPMRLVTPMPLAPPWLLGVLRFRDELISAVSSMALFGPHGWTTDPEVLIVVRSRGRVFGLDVEEAPRPLALDVATLEQGRRQGAVSELRDAHGLLKLLDADALLQSLESGRAA